MPLRTLHMILMWCLIVGTFRDTNSWKEYPPNLGHGLVNDIFDWHLATLQHIVMDSLAALALDGSSLTLGFNGTTDDGDFQLRRKFPWRNQTRRKSVILQWVLTMKNLHSHFLITTVPSRNSLSLLMSFGHLIRLFLSPCKTPDCKWFKCQWSHEP